jgi:hypothetical protein
MYRVVPSYPTNMGQKKDEALRMQKEAQEAMAAMMMYSIYPSWLVSSAGDPGRGKSQIVHPKKKAWP